MHNAYWKQHKRSADDDAGEADDSAPKPKRGRLLNPKSSPAIPHLGTQVKMKLLTRGI